MRAELGARLQTLRLLQLELGQSTDRDARARLAHMVAATEHLRTAMSELTSAAELPPAAQKRATEG
jgi:hypothetical protein